MVAVPRHAVPVCAGETGLDYGRKTGYGGGMTLRKDIAGSRLADLIKQVQAGNEVLLTQDEKLVAKIVPAHEPDGQERASFRVRSLRGHRVLTPGISQAELADEMFGQS